MNTPFSSTKPWYEILASLAPLIVGVGVTGVAAVFTGIYNSRQLQLNQLAALDKFRSALVSDNPVEREFAYASFAVLGYEELALKIMQVKRDSAGRAVAQDIQLTGSASAKAEAKATLTALPAQVYGHIGPESQRAKAAEALSALQTMGLVPLGVENVTGKAIVPKTTEVRYFNDEDRPQADAIVKVLRERGWLTSESKRVAIPSVKRGTIEVWFGAEGT